MASMQAELNGTKRVPKTNAKKCMQNRFPDNGPPLYLPGFSGDCDLLRAPAEEKNRQLCHVVS